MRKKKSSWKNLSYCDRIKYILFGLLIIITLVSVIWLAFKIG